MENTSKEAYIFPAQVCMAADISWCCYISSATSSGTRLIGDTHKNCTVKTQSLCALLGPATSRVDFFPPLPVTPGLILMLKYFLFATWHSFSRPVWICMEERNSFHGDADPSLSFSLLRAAPLPMTPSTCSRPPECVWFYYVPCAGPGLGAWISASACCCVWEQWHFI